MADAIQAPANAEGPTSHTQNQAPRLSPYQLRMLHGGIHNNRVRNLRGMAHLEAWDVRRQLIRIFGFGGFTIETISLDLVAERENKQGERSRWTVVYRAQVRLTVFDTSGREIAHFEDGAAGDSVNQPSLGDAHDMGMKTALSQALKRCAVNLGDQFGLSLYNDGSRDAVVNYSAAHPPQEWQKQEAPQQPVPEDPPVRPEPQPQPMDTEADSAPAESVQPQAEHSRPAEATPETDPVQDALLDKLMRRAVEHRFDVEELAKVRAEAEAKKVIDGQVPGPPPERALMPFHQLLDLLVEGAKAAQRGEHERSAA